MGMEIPGRRSAYSLLSQFPDEPPPLTSSSDRGLRIPFAAGLQRQSSGSSYGESSLSGDYYAPATVVMEGRPKEGSGSASSAAAKSWAQQAEETYQLQLALALRLCSDASSASDPNLLDPGCHIISTEILSAKSLSHRFWDGDVEWRDFRRSAARSRGCCPLACGCCCGPGRELNCCRFCGGLDCIMWGIFD